MTVAIIGTGNMAWFLAQRLLQSGHSVSGLYGRDPGQVRLLAREYHLPVYSSLSAIQDGPDACIIAVADHAVGQVCSQLQFRETMLLHTAGALPSSVLESSARLYGVLWPVYSLLKHDLPVHRDIPCAWEGNSGKAAALAQSLAEAIGNLPFQASSEQRKWLHLCAVVENNFVNHLMAISESICKEQNLPVQVLQPLLMQTFQRNQLFPATETQTGPARRGDYASQKAHLSLLGGKPEWQQVYEAISRSIEKMYEREVKESRDMS